MTSIIGALLCWLGAHRWGAWKDCDLCNKGNSQHKVKHAFCVRPGCKESTSLVTTEYAVNCPLFQRHVLKDGATKRQEGAPRC